MRGRCTCLGEQRDTVAVGEAHEDVSIEFGFLFLVFGFGAGVLSTGSHPKYYKLKVGSLIQNRNQAHS